MTENIKTESKDAPKKPAPKKPAAKNDVEPNQAATAASTDSGSTLVVVEQDVYEKFYFPGTKRPAYRMRFRAGQVVTQADLDAFNAQDEATPDGDSDDSDA